MSNNILCSLKKKLFVLFNINIPYYKILFNILHVMFFLNANNNANPVIAEFRPLFQTIARVNGEFNESNV